MLIVRDLIKSFAGSARSDRVQAVDGVSFEVAQGEFFTLLGPSGCGKTTTLRSIAGLERPDEGFISVGGRVVLDSTARKFVQPNHRGIGMVFQSYAIWPHMTVFENVAFPLRVGKARFSGPDLRSRVIETLRLVRLDALADRPATTLSGGQQQRLALARALVFEPVLMLLDEPLSNLDAKLRESMRFELKRLQTERNLTTIYVTHDQAEALALSTRVAVMNEGRIEQLGTPDEVYDRPATSFVADFIGSANLLPGRVTAVSRTDMRVDVVGGPLVVGPGDFAIGDNCLVAIRPEHIEIRSPDRDHDPNDREGVVLAAAFVGQSVDYEIQVQTVTVRCRTPAAIRLPSGSTVTVHLVASRCIALPATRERQAGVGTA